MNNFGGKKLYEYRGPVRIFEEIVNSDWHGYTYAMTEKQARNNLTYQYKRQRGLIPETKVTLTGKVFESLDERVG